ncbi:MAG: hypothetical protein AAFR47_24185 [Pseudomonadota bacterium]
MRTLQILEICTAIATLVSACFVGWQAYLLRQSLDAPYLANLQDRQIDACASYRVSYEQFHAEAFPAPSDRVEAELDTALEDLSSALDLDGEPKLDPGRGLDFRLTTAAQIPEQAASNLLGEIGQLEFFAVEVSPHTDRIRASLEDLRVASSVGDALSNLFESLRVDSPPTGLTDEEWRDFIELSEAARSSADEIEANEGDPRLSIEAAHEEISVACREMMMGHHFD